MSDSIEYKINTLDDILKVPSDSLDVMFSELIPHIKRFASSKEIMVAAGMVPEGMHIDDMVKLGTMTWIDDGKKNVTTNVTFKSKEEGAE